MADEITLDDVARKSGVSRATASRALNNRTGVKADVRERVMLIAQSLGYRPNRSARNLAGGRASVVGLVVGRETLGQDPYSTSVIQATANAADQYDEGLMLLVGPQEPSRTVQSLVKDGIIDGVVVSAEAARRLWVEDLLDRLPTVLIGAHPRRTDIPVVSVENLESSAALVGALLDSGRARVAMIGGPQFNRVDAALRVAGYRLAHERRSLAVDESLIVHGNYTRQSAYDLADTVLEWEPDAVFAANDEMALGLLDRCQERGLAVPEQLYVVGFDGLRPSLPVGPRLTTMHQPMDLIALRAVETLLAMIRGERVPPEQLIEPTFVAGDTASLPLSEPETGQLG